MGDEVNYPLRLMKIDYNSITSDFSTSHSQVDSQPLVFRSIYQERSNCEHLRIPMLKLCHFPQKASTMTICNISCNLPCLYLQIHLIHLIQYQCQTVIVTLIYCYSYGHAAKFLLSTETHILTICQHTAASVEYVKLNIHKIHIQRHS